MFAPPPPPTAAATAAASLRNLKRSSALYLLSLLDLTCLLVRFLPFPLRFALCGLLAFADETLLLVLDASQSIDFFRLFALDFCGSVESDADWGAAGGTD